MKNPIVHFEIPADDVKRAKRFYEKAFGWKIEKTGSDAEPYWMVRTTPIDKRNMPTVPGAINGGLMARKPGQTFMNYISVPSIDEMTKIIRENGGSMVMQKQEIGEDMGWIAAFRDPEGNIMGLHEMAKTES